MKNKTLIGIVCIIICSLLNINGQGFEIYQVKHNYPDFTIQRSDSFCYYCFEPTKSDLFDTALIKQSEIEYFDWENQQLKLNDKKAEELKNIEIPLQGLAVAIAIDREPIYGFWLWNMVSSFGCDRVYAYPELGFKIEFGLPKGNTKGIDPRFDVRIKNYLIETKLIK